MQYKVSIPNDRDLHSDEECAKVKGKWKELNVYQNLASLVLTPSVTVAFWRGTWDLMDYYSHQFFPVVPTLIASALFVLILELLRNTFISKHLKILDGDSRMTVLKKNILLSFYDIVYNLSNVALWRVLWGHPQGRFENLREHIHQLRS